MTSKSPESPYTDDPLLQASISHLTSLVKVKLQDYFCCNHFDARSYFRKYRKHVRRKLNVLPDSAFPKFQSSTLCTGIYINGPELITMDLQKDVGGCVVFILNAVELDVCVYVWKRTDQIHEECLEHVIQSYRIRKEIMLIKLIASNYDSFIDFNKILADRVEAISRRLACILVKYF